MRNAGLEEHKLAILIPACVLPVHHEKRWTGRTQAGIKIARRNINNLRYVDDTTLMADSEEELKSLLMNEKVESGKSWLKAQHSENEDHGVRSHRFMGNRWVNSGNSDRLHFFGSRITAPEQHLAPITHRCRQRCRWNVGLAQRAVGELGT